MAEEQNDAVLSELEMRELYKQIDVREGSVSCEIRHPIHGGNVTVYRPERDDLDSHRQGTPVIKPGYINASSWCTGGLSPKQIKDVHAGMLIQLRIMEIALDKLNKYNSVLPIWTEIPNPWDDADRLRHAHHALDSLRTENEALKVKGKNKKGGKHGAS